MAAFSPVTAHLTSRRPRAAWLLAAVAIPALLFGAACSDDDDEGGNADEVTIGALFSLEGSGSTLGKASKAALELAAERLNADDSADLPEITIDVRDSKQNPDAALEQIKALHADGVRIIVGPQSSSEVRAIAEFVEENDITLISQGSTASSLALPGDSIYRLAPDDRRESAAMSAVIKAAGITHVIPLWRADVGNTGHQTSIRPALAASGITVSAGQEYPTADPDFEAVLDEVEKQLEALPDGAMPAIYVAAFDEVVGLLSAAAARDAIADLPWYGSDGVALSAALIADDAAAAFAVKSGYPNPVFGLSRTAEAEAVWKPIFDEVTARAGVSPDAFALSMYDSVGLIARAVKEAGGTDPEEFGAALVAEAAAVDGITGNLALNEAGDRADGAFDFWVVCEADDGYEWAVSFAYVPAAAGGQATLTELEGCGS